MENNKSNNTEPIIKLNQAQLDNAEQNALDENVKQQEFNMNAGGTEKVDALDFLNNKKSRNKSFLNTGETQYVDTSEYSDYLSPNVGGAYKFPFQADYDKSRAINQSNWEQTGRALTKLIPNTALEFVSMLGNTLDVEDYANSDNEIGNWLSSWAQDRKAELNEALPTYRENPGESLDIGDYAWWVENGSALVESAAAFVGLGYLTGAGALNALSKGGKALEFLNVIGKGARATDSVKRGTQTAAGLMNTMMLNQAEGVGVAVQVYDQAYKDSLAKFQAEGDADAEGKAKVEAAKKATMALNFNRTNILLNLTSAFSFIKTPSLSRNLLAAPSIKKSAKKTAYESTQEYFEEVVNLGSEKAALNGATDFGSFMDETIKAAQTEEGVEAGLSGLVGGGAQTLMTNAGREVNLRKDKQGNRTSDNALQRERFEKQQEAITRWEALSKGEKFSQSSDAYLKADEAYTLYKDLKTAIDNKDTKTANDIKDKLLRNQAYDAFSTGTTDSLLGVFQGIFNMTPEQAEAKGLDVETYKQKSQEALSLITDLEKEYNKAQAFVDSYSVYENRTDNHFLKDSRRKVNTVKQEVIEEVASDLTDLGIADDVYEIDENGKYKFHNYNRYGKKKKDAIKNLSSLQTYYMLNERLASIDKDIETKTEEYTTLTSDAYQEEQKNKIKETAAKIRKEAKEKARTQRQAKNSKRKKDFKAKFTSKKDEAAAEITEDVDYEDVTDVEESPANIPNGKPFQFTRTGDEDIDKGLTALEETDNGVFSHPTHATDKKIAWFNKQLNELAARTDIPEATKKGMTAQYNKNIRALEAKLAEEEAASTSNDIANNAAADSIREVADLLEDADPALLEEDSDLDPSTKTQGIMDKIEAVNTMLDKMEQAGIATGSFPPIAKQLQKVLGAARFSKLFNIFKDVYNLTNRGIRSEDSYADIFFTEDEKIKIVENETENVMNTYLKDMYNVSDTAFKAKLDESIQNLLKSQGYAATSESKAILDGYRVVNAVDNLAHLDKLYNIEVKEIIDPLTGAKIYRINKTDFDREIKAASEIVDPNIIKKGDSIQLKVLDEVVYDDGTIVKADGTVIKNGEVISKDALANAPIVVVHNNKIINGLFLHLPKWIDATTIADSSEVKEQRKQLELIRQAVLDAPNQTITTVITERSNGHVMLDPDGTMSSTSKNLPKATIAVAKDGVLYTSKHGSIEVDRSTGIQLHDGYTYAVFPSAGGRQLAMPIQPKLVKDMDNVVDSLVTAVELHLNNNANDPRVKELSEKTGINVTTVKGLKRYLDTYLHLNNKLDFEYEKFKKIVEAASEKSTIIRMVGGSLEFGRGANVGDTLRYINRDVLNDKFPPIQNESGVMMRNPEKTKMIKALLGKFRNVLENNTRFNVNKDLLNSSISAAVFTEDGVSVTNAKYSDFVKQNTVTSQYSIELDNGTTVYTVQQNIKYATNFAVKPEIGKEGKEGVPPTNDTPPDSPKKKAKKVTKKFGRGTLTIDFDKTIDEDLDPLTTSVNTEIVDIFQASPELSNIGTAQQYQDYLHSVFPASEVQDVLYRTGKLDTNNELLFMSKDKEYGKGLYFEDEVVHPIIINTIKPYIITEHSKLNQKDDASILKNQSFDSLIVDSRKYKTNPTETDILNEVAILNNKSNYLVLGSEIDIRNFKSYVDATNDLDPIQAKLNQIGYNLKAVNILSSDKAKQVFAKGKKNGWDLNKILTELQVPKEQKQIILDKNWEVLNQARIGDLKSFDIREEIITSLLADNSFTVEINIAKDNDISYLFSNSQNKHIVLDNIKQPLAYFDSKEEADDYIKNYDQSKPTQHYSNLTVPGGTNYTENAIQTPNIINSSKTHINEFANGIANMLGWFRSDEQENVPEYKKDEIKSEITATKKGYKLTYTEKATNNVVYSEETTTKEEAETLLDTLIVTNENRKTLTKTRRVLEVQSGVYQKGRDEKDLINKEISLSRNNDEAYYDLNGWRYGRKKDTYSKGIVGEDNTWVNITKEEYYSELVPENQFLQLLNKNNNWVTFFLQSIIQDSAKKGYEKVLFPKGDTAAKVQGHGTLEEFKKQTEDRIKELENDKEIYHIALINDKTSNGILNSFSTKQEALDDVEKNNNSVIELGEKITYEFREENLNLEEIKTLKQELADIESGKTQLSSIASFYENDVTNILNKKYKGKVTEVVDEHGNTWNEVEITPEMQEDIDLDPKTLTKEDLEEYARTTPSSLTIQGISLPVQESIINYLTYNILADVIEGNKKLALDYLDEYHSFIVDEALVGYKEQQALPSTPEGKYDNTIKTLEAIDANFDKIRFIVYDKLRTFNNLKVNGTYFEHLAEQADKSEEYVDNIIEEESDTNEDSASWRNEGAFLDDFRDSVSLKLKNFFSTILDVEDFTYNEGEREAIIKTDNFLGMEVPVPFDHVINEISGILAYNNFATTVVEPTLDSMIATLEEWVNTKPFLHNVIEKLKTADETIQKEFIQVMSKHYTNHVYVFRNKSGKLFVNNSDNNGVTKVIQDHWLNNMIDSSIVTINEDKNYILNEDVVNRITDLTEELVVKLQDNDKDIDDVVADAKVILDLMGFNFDTKVIKEIEEKGIFYSSIPHNLLELFDNTDGAFKIHIDNLNSLLDKDLQENHPFANNSALFNFTRSFAKYNPTYFINSFRDVRGRLYYAYSQNKFITDRFKDLLNDDELIAKLRAQPYSKDSRWLSQMDDPSFRRHFQYFTMDGLRLEGGKGKKLDATSPAEYEEIKLNLFFSQNRRGNDFITNLYYPTTSNKTVQYGIKVLGRKWSDLITTKNTPTDVMLDLLYQDVVQPEINRILNLQLNPDFYNIKSYKEGGTQFNIIPSLNSLSILWDNETHTLKDDIEIDVEAQIAIKNELRSFVINLVKEKIAKWKDLGFTEVNTQPVYDEVTNKEYNASTTHLVYDTNKTSTVTHDAYDFVLNYLVGNVNVSQLFTTDPAFYWKSSIWKTYAIDSASYTQMMDTEGNQLYTTEEEAKAAIKNGTLTREDVIPFYTSEEWMQEHEDLFNNLGKRLGADGATGDVIPNSNTNKVRYGILSDNDREAYLIDYYKGLIKGNYPKVSPTDAQEFTTLYEHLYLMMEQGEITQKKMNELLAKDKAGTKFSKADKLILQPMKPVYVHNIWTNGIEHRFYVKSSSFPLYKQLTKGLEIDKLRVAMEKGKFDRVAFESAVKIGGVNNPTVLYKDNLGNVSDNIFITPVGDGEGISRSGFRKQQKMPYKTKQIVNHGSQQIKLITSAIRPVKGFKVYGEEGTFTGQQIQDKFDETYNELYRIKYDELVKEIGFDVVNQEITEFKTLQQILKNEALERKYSLYDLEALNIENNDFAIPLWLTGVSGKIEAMLNSIVDNRIRKIKVKGDSFILGSSEGFKPVKTGDEAQEFIKNETNIAYDEEWFKRGDHQLLPVRVVDGVVHPAEVMIPFKMKDSKGKMLKASDYITNGFIDYTKVDADVLKLFGFRIPTQALKSMSMIKVVGFLPESSGDLMLAPADWTVKMGSDFDIDKLYALLYNIDTNEEGKIIRYAGRDRTLKLENYLVDLHFSVISNKSKKVQDELSRPLSFGNLIDKDKESDLVREIYPYVGNNQKGRGMTEEYQTFKFRNARAGTAGIGVFSTDSTFNAIIQNKDVYLQKMVKGVAVEKRFKVMNKWSNKMSNPKTNTGKYKADVIEFFQSLSVDDENEQGMHKLNINNYTFDAIRGLVSNGFDEDYVTWFINQPIIRRYVELKAIVEDSITPYTSEDMMSTLAEEFPITDENFADNYKMYSNMNLEYLKVNLIEGSKDKTILDTSYQRFLLSQFNMVSEYGKTIKGLQSAVNSDSAGLGKDLFYSSEKENQIMGLRDKTNVANADKLIGDYLMLFNGNSNDWEINPNDTNIVKLTKEWYKGKLTEDRKAAIVNELMEEGYMPVTPISKGRILNSIRFIKPTTINGYASVYGLMFNNVLWSRYFPYNNIKLQRTLKTISEAINKKAESINDRAELNRSLFNAVKSYLSADAVSSYSTTPDINEERERLLVDTPDNQSIASIVDTLVKEGKLNNAFTNRLLFDINKVILPSTIKYQANLAENLDERGVYAAFSKMFSDTRVIGEFNGKPYTVQLVAQEMVNAQLMTGGLQQANQFIKYVPTNYLQLIGYYDYIKGINFNDEGQINYRRIKNQLHQHNPKDVVLTAKLEEYIDGNQYSYYNGKTIIAVKGMTMTSLPSVFSVYDPDTIKNYRIYFYNNDKGIWEQKDTLGINDILEYDSQNDFGSTMVGLNKVPTDVEVTLPTTREENKERLTPRKKPSEDPETVYSPIDTSIEAVYGLNEDTTSLGKVQNILNQIIDNDLNPLHTYFAESLLSNLDKIKDYKFIVDYELNAKGKHSYLDKTIRVNPNQAINNEGFESTVLEEIIHAFTKGAIINNENGEVLRLKALRREAEEVVRKHLKGGADIKFKTVQRKIDEGIPLNKLEYELIYPVLTDVEFVGRLFKSKELQKLLNDTPSNVEGKSVWDKFVDLIKDLMAAIGIDVKSDSVLAYAMTDIISLIKQPTPLSSITGKLNELDVNIRTKSFIENQFGLRTDKGNQRKIPNADEVVKYINDNIINLSAVNRNGYVDITTKDSQGNQLDMFADEDLDPGQELTVVPLLKSLNNRIHTLENNIDKARQRKDEVKVSQLKDTLEKLIERRNESLSMDTLRAMHAVGVEDVAELKEMFNHRVSLEDTLYMRKLIHFWESAVDLLFTEEDKQSDILLKDYKDLESSVLKYKNKLERIENDYMEKLLKKYGTDMSVEDIFYHFKDINAIQSKVLDISRSDNGLLDTAFMLNKEANIDATTDVQNMLKDLDKKEAAIKPILRGLGYDELYEVFRQKTSNGFITGHLINRYSHKFFKDRRNVLNDINNDPSSATYSRLVDWAHNNTVHLNLNLLFPLVKLEGDKLKEANAYKEELKAELGERHYNEVMAKQESYINQFNARQQGYLEYLWTQYNVDNNTDLLNIQEAYERYDYWLKTNSPYELAKQIKTGESKSKGNNFKSNSHDHYYFVPSTEEGYDKDYEVIENNEDLLDFYEYFTKIDSELKAVLPTSDKIRLTMEGLPFVNKMLLEQYKDKGMKIGLLPFWDALKDSTRRNEEGIIDYSIKDPVTSTVEKSLKFNLTQNNRTAISEYVEQKRAEYLLEFKVAPEREMLELFREEAIDMVAQKKSYDLPKVLRVYALTALAYKHKAKIEDSLKLSQNILYNQKENIRNNRGDIMVDPAGRVEPKNTTESFKNTKAQFDYFINAFYGINKEDEGITQTKVLNSEEKAKLTELNDLLLELEQSNDAGLIEHDEYIRSKTNLEAQINSLGGVAVWSRRGDAILKYVQLKGMGWNVMSSIANIGFGFISNYIEASGGQLYTMKQLNAAYKLTMGSVGRNATFNNKHIGQSKKIRSLMDKWNVLHTATEELFKSPMTIETGKKTKWLAPYNLTQRTEYINQAPLMIASAMNTKVTVDGKEITVWEAMDEDGNWKTEYGEEPTQVIKKLRIKIDQLVKMNHGNYDPNSPLAVKNKFLGRALSQFRSWMFEGYAVRFESSKYDKALDIERKGRYISFMDFFKGVGIAEGASVTLKGLAKTLTFGKAFSGTSFDDYVNGESITETDAANMRKVLTELVMLMSLQSAYILLSTLAAGLDDEEDKMTVYLLNNMLNQGLRLKTDIIFYLSPGGFKDLLRDVIPASTVIKDSIDWSDSVFKMISGNDEIKSGVYSGHSRFLRETAQMLPLGTQIYKNINYSVQTFEKD